MFYLKKLTLSKFILRLSSLIFIARLLIRSVLVKKFFCDRLDT